MARKPWTPPQPIHNHTPIKGWEEGKTVATVPLTVPNCPACKEAA